ncbi:SDR family NAD(P)-dependent oxidoreductase [Corallococcus macrosporus]|uniref:Putative non-ribosomal peptide synthetase n=1 Tax=Myxococcus fulvus (strain ATCC BAA-855 / HW-1) TaxID=483219 RepID=F8C9S6_MYXFH|nr:SDR family NAD(P)-dependent oxidoreductase [Corallococcus macrosporus]AEI62076.1 putative non-ribosomal peptide synthetase [Corallococcus macrosporus]
MVQLVEEFLRAEGRVRDVWVSPEVAWVVPRRAVRAAELDALLHERLGARVPAVALVDALPRLDSGAVDEAALRRGAPPVPARLQSLEDALRQQGIEAVALVGPQRDEEVHTPLDALLPADLLSKAGGVSPVSSKRSVAEARAHTEARPSLIDSGPRRMPDGAPRTLVELLRQAVEHGPQLAITFIDVQGQRETLTFSALWDEALRLWGGLRARGAKAGDRVMLAMERPGDFVRGFWACTLGGVVPVPLALPASLERSQPGVARLLSVSERLGAPLLLTDGRASSALTEGGLRALALESLAGAAPGRPADVAPESPAILSFTSGSTGRPKGVVLTHANLMAMGEGMVAGGWYLPGDLGVSWMPLDHVAGTSYPHLLALRTRTPHVLVARDYVLADVLRWLDLLTEFGGTMSWAPNFAYGLVADRLERGERRAWRLHQVRVLGCGGESVLPATLRRFSEPLRDNGLREDAVCPAWGMAETSSYFTMTRGVRGHPVEGATELGPPPVGAALRVVDDADVVVPEGQVGHLQARGAQVLSGYLDDAELNARSFTADGWFRTGDMAVIQDGQMAIAGRQKEVLILHGNNVYPQDIEEVVESVPGVLPSYTVACPTRSGAAQTDELAVCFVPAPDAPPLAELLRSIREKVGRVLGFHVAHLLPLARQQVPRTELGKRGRTELRRRFEAGELVAEHHRALSILGGPATMPPCLAVARWVPRPLASSVSKAETQGAVVVIADEAFAGAMREQMRGREVVRVAPEASGDLVHVLGALAERGLPCGDVVVRLPDVGGEAPAPDAVHQRPVSGAGDAEARRVVLAASVAPLLRALQALSAGPGVRVLAVLPETGTGTHGAGTQAALLAPGLLWAAAAEVPGLEARVTWAPSDASAAAHAAAREVTSQDAAREVAWRDGTRWERLFTPWTPPPLAAPQRLKREGLYLVTGALGGLGREWARQLRQGVDARLLLVGRRAHGPEARALEAELGAAKYLSVDVTDEAALREAVRHAEAHFGQPCDGAFHFAGTLTPTPVADETPESFVQGAAAHALGALSIAAVLEGRPQAVCVFAASLMGTLGAGRHAAYCAGTAFLERLAERLTAQGRHAAAVSLSQVRETGLARALGTAPPGYRVLEPSQALASVALAGEHAPAHLLVGVVASAWPWRQAGLGSGRYLDAAHVFLVPPPRPEGLSGAVLHPLTEWPRRADSSVDREALAADLSGTGDGTPAGPFETVVMEAFREVLGAQGVGAGSDFFTLGGSSLQATRVVARINERTGLRLREVALFEHPTATALADHVRRVVDLTQLDISVLSDAQVDLLLRVLAPT